MSIRPYSAPLFSTCCTSEQKSIGAKSVTVDHDLGFEWTMDAAATLSQNISPLISMTDSVVATQARAKARSSDHVNAGPRLGFTVGPGVPMVSPDRRPLWRLCARSRPRFRWISEKCTHTNSHMPTEIARGIVNRLTQMEIISMG